MPFGPDESVAAATARPTMNDVAVAAGVALKTVSRVVNGEDGVGEETAARVREAIDQLGYLRNDGARRLRQGSRSSSIGLVLEDLADPFYSQLSRAVEEVARTHGALLFAGSSAEDPVRERELALDFCSRRVDGLIIVPTAADHAYLAPELAAGTKVVSVDRPVTGVDVDTVLVDNRAGIAAGVDHLTRRGHRRIGYLGDSLSIFTAAERCAGFRQAMARAGLAVDEACVASGRPDTPTVGRALDRMLSGPEPITALLCGNNRSTVAVLRDLAARRSRLALVGFDDFELADLLPVPVTVIAQDPASMGRLAAELLFQRMNGGRAPSRRIELPTRLIARGSGEIEL